MFDLFALNPQQAIYGGKIWQFLTFMYVHAGIEHILLNMFALFIFGPRIEEDMGSMKFLIFYTICGIFSGLFHILITGVSDIPLVGASGAIFGVMAAFGLMHLRQIIYVQLFIPMPAVIFIALMAGIEILYWISGAQTGIRNWGHVGGMFMGLILVKFLGFNKRRRIRYRYVWEWYWYYNVLNSFSF